MAVNNRWGIAAAGFLMQMALGAVYAWSVFRTPLTDRFHWSISQVTLTFTICIFVLGVSAFFGGLWLNKSGPRIVALTAGLLYGLGVFLASYSGIGLWWLYLTYGLIGGVGLGFGYIVPVAVLLKWFPDRRGLAAGATAAGFGAGAAITVVPIANMIAASGYQSAFFTFGIGQGVIVLALAFFLRKPSQAMPAKKKQLNLPQTKIDFTPPQVLRSPIFWVMYLVFVMVAAGGLMTAAQIAPIAHDFKIADAPVGILGFQMAALTFAISLDRIFDGFGRPFFGWVSDHIGREHTMFIAFGTAALMLLTLSVYGHIPIVFVLATAVYFGVFGEIYSLFPATSGDTFGVKFATTNNGMLYTAKGTASLLVPLASLVAASYGWQAVFVIAVALNATAALLALFVIKPMRRAFILGNEATASARARDVRAA